MKRRAFFSRGAVTLLRVRSVPILAHWTLLVILPYMAFAFASQFTAAARAAGVAAGATAIPPIVYGLLIALGLFVSIAIHELAHTFVAVRAGGRVRAITLMMLGGVSQIEQLPKRPRNEALMAAAGPLTSFVIAAVLFIVERFIVVPGPRIAVFYLARLNLVLAVFNLLPAFPMDGGRILRALLAGRMGMVRATRVAATVGKVSAVVFGIIGAIGGSIILMLIALFLFSGAGFELRAHEMKEALRHLRVGDIMASPVPTIGLDATVADAIDRMRMSSRMDLLVADDALHGVVRAGDLARADEWLRLRDLGSDILVPCIAAAPDENAGDALERASERDASYLVVIARTAEHASVVGLVGPGELEHAFALRSLGRRRRNLVGPPSPA